MLSWLIRSDLEDLFIVYTSFIFIHFKCGNHIKDRPQKSTFREGIHDTMTIHWLCPLLHAYSTIYMQNYLYEIPFPFPGITAIVVMLPPVSPTEPTKLDTSKSLRQRFKCSSPQQPKTFSPVTKALESVQLSLSVKGGFPTITTYANLTRGKNANIWHLFQSSTAEI